ncbi:hypothetical protein [Streptomyces sp. NPDC091371]|uniref:hypothetical protein n=1 Tax=Streptomyces sp. NPDC091371 TaxID=3155303 RepID=UPI00343F13ED
MQRSTVDGVTLLSSSTPGTLTAMLAFGCGIRDETAPTMGVTRLIEALVMNETGPRLHQYGSTVHAEETRFHAAGTPEAVADFLHTVCRTLSDLPLHRTEHTARLLGIDGALIPEHQAVAPLGARFGPHSYGLALHHNGDMYTRLTPDTVHAHAATHFTRGNAVLALDGPIPQGLTLPLPEGPPPQRTTPRTRAGRSWQHRPVDTVSLLLTSGASSAPAITALMTLRRRVERTARDRLGISNSVTGHYFIRDRLTQDRVLLLDTVEGHAEEAAETLWSETRRLTREGPDQTELDAFTAQVRAEHDYIAGHWNSLERAVAAELFGTPYLDDRTLLERLQAVTPQDVRHYLEQALTDAVLVVPHQTHPRLEGPRGTGLRNSDCWRTEGPATPGTVFPMPRLRRATPAATHADTTSSPPGASSAATATTTSTTSSSTRSHS